MGKVKFISQADACSLANPVNMISIRCSCDQDPIFLADHNVIRLVFDDVEGFIGSREFEVFSHIQARKIIDFISGLAGADFVVHCQAGMSRSAAVAKYAAEYMGYELDLCKPCIGTTEFYNRHVYGTLNLTRTDNLASYYAEMELADRMTGAQP